MKTDALIQVMRSITAIDDNEKAALFEILQPRGLRKNEKLWNIGDYCRHVAFISKGAVRYYFYKDGKEINGQFFFENSFFTSYYSFIANQPIEYVFEAIEDCELILLPRNDLNALYDNYKCFERLGRLIAEQNFISMHNFRLKLHSQSPEDLYLDLINRRPHVIERVPLYMIASYLGITPEHLSRIRRKVVGGGKT